MGNSRDHIQGIPAILDISDLLYTTDHDPADLRRALELPALPEGWRASFRALLDADERLGNAGLTAPQEPPSWVGFRPFVVTDVIRDSDNVRSFVLAPDDGVALARHRPGQFVSLRVPSDEGSLVRSYSLSQAADGVRLRISVKCAGTRR